METKANYTAVGAFVLGFIVFIGAFLVWVSGVSLIQRTKSLDIIFTRVSGLKEGSPVRYQGLQVGTVKSIHIDSKHPKQIVVNATIEEDVPLKKDVMASIELQGITGTSFIQLGGGSEQAPDIQFGKKETPHILGRSSSLDKVIDNAPGVLSEFSALTTDLKDVVSEENREAFRNILFNIKELTDALKSREEGGASGVTLGSEIIKTIRQFRKAVEEIEGAAKEIRLTFFENRESLKVFTGSGLTTLTKLFNEVKETLSAFKRVSEAIERSPTRFLHNDPDKGVRLK